MVSCTSFPPRSSLFRRVAAWMMVRCSCASTGRVYIRRVTPSWLPRRDRMACSSVDGGYSFTAHTLRHVLPHTQLSG